MIWQFALRPRHRNQKINFGHMIFHLLRLSLYFEYFQIGGSSKNWRNIPRRLTITMPARAAFGITAKCFPTATFLIFKIPRRQNFQIIWKILRFAKKVGMWIGWFQTLFLRKTKCQNFRKKKTFDEVVQNQTWTRKMIFSIFGRHWIFEKL